TSGTFRGEFGHRYAFFSVATDTAGNREIPLNEPQAETELVPLPLLALVSGDGNFGRLLAGSAAPRRSFTFRSDGSGEVAIGALTIAGGGAAAFALENDGCSGRTLAPGASCAVDVVCTQAAAGAAAATLTIPSSDPAGPVLVPLSVRIVRLLVSPTEGAAGVELSIAGSGFGTKKPKVYVGSTALAVVSSSDTSIRAKLAKAASAGDYAVKVQPAVKGAAAITESAAFTIRRPELLTVSPATVAAGETLTIGGRFFGITKGKVTIAAGKTLSCAVTSWPRSESGGETTIKCRVPKGLTPGPATVTVASGAGSTALAGRLTVR
nr:IPT/TIG domain-containing protein [Acidobacteriota bacterium]